MPGQPGGTEAYVGAPVGPQPAVVIRLLREVVLPEVACP